MIQAFPMVLRFVPSAMKVRIAVAGGTGGLGHAIVNGLLSEGHEVFVLSRKVIPPFLFHFASHQIISRLFGQRERLL